MPSPNEQALRKVAELKQIRRTLNLPDHMMDRRMGVISGVTVGGEHYNDFVIGVGINFERITCNFWLVPGTVTQENCDG